MATGNPRGRTPDPEPSGPPNPAIRQPHDKSAKLFYGDKRMVAEFLAKHVFGKIVPADVAADIDLDGLQPGPTEHVDPKLRTSRHADLVWRAPFRDSWFYIVLLFEFQSTSDWRMAVRILLETALVYDYMSRGKEATKAHQLPPVLPIVVHVGTEPWTAPTRLEDLLADEAKAFLPFALGHQSVLVSESEEAEKLEHVTTAREAALKLRYAADGAEFQEAVAALRSLLPPDSVAREGLLAWVRSSMLDEGAKEEVVAQLEHLDDLAGPVVKTWWAKERREILRKGQEEGRQEGRQEGRREGRQEGREHGRREGSRALLERLVANKFGADAAVQLAGLIGGLDGRDELDAAADAVIECDTVAELLARLAN